MYRSFKKVGWSFVVEYRFDDFLQFCHDCTVVLEYDMKSYPILITNIEISDMGFPETYRGHYLIQFDILEQSGPQLTLF